MSALRPRSSSAARWALVAATGLTALAGPAAAMPAGEARGARLTLPAQAADTTLRLSRGDRVVLEGLSGTVTVEATSGDRMEISGRAATDAVAVRRSGSRVLVGQDGQARRGRPVDLLLRLPAWAAVEVDGRNLDVSVRGMAGPVEVRIMSGDARVVGTTGPVRVHTLAGDIVAEDASGALVLSSESDDVTVRGATGSVDVRSLDGDLLLEGLRASEVRAETHDGDVVFDGVVAAGGAYRFFVHDGDVTLGLPVDLSAVIGVSTFHGEFQSEFPVRVSGFTSGRSFEFEVGGGAAEIRVEVFDGEIRLVRR